MVDGEMLSQVHAYILGTLWRFRLRAAARRGQRDASMSDIELLKTKFGTPRC